jgi:hypothetical protein
MKSYLLVFILLAVMVTVIGCEKKQTISVTGPSGEKASATFPQ